MFKNLALFKIYGKSKFVMLYPKKKSGSDI